MSKKTKEIELIPDTSKASKWKVKYDGKEGSNPNQGGPDAFPKVKLAEDSGPQLLVFKLPKEGKVVFNANDPMWIQKTDPANPSSPTQSGMDPQFPSWTVLDGGKTLVVLDKNSEKAVYSYRVEADNYPTVLDPIVDNGGGVGGVIDPPGFGPGGGGGVAYANYLLAAGLGILAGILITLLVQRMRR